MKLHLFQAILELFNYIISFLHHIYTQGNPDPDGCFYVKQIGIVFCHPNCFLMSANTKLSGLKIFVEKKKTFPARFSVAQRLLTSFVLFSIIPNFRPFPLSHFNSLFLDDPCFIFHSADFSV